MSDEVQTENQTVEKKKSRKGKSGKPKPTAAQIAFRREKISELMLAGIDEGGVRRIAAYLNEKLKIECSKSTVANDINFLLEQSAKNSTENLEQMRALAYRQLEQLRQAHWIGAQTSVNTGKFVRTLINDQCELYGTKAAKKIEHSGDKENPVHVKHSNSVDLSNVSKDDLLLMEAILAKAETEKDAA